MKSDKDPFSTRENEKEPLDLTAFKPEHQVFQRLCLCEYLAELPEDPDKKEP